MYHSAVKYQQGEVVTVESRWMTIFTEGGLVYAPNPNKRWVTGLVLLLRLFPWRFSRLRSLLPGHYQRGDAVVLTFASNHRLAVRKQPFWTH